MKSNIPLTKALLILLVCYAHIATAQSIFVTHNGYIRFFSDTPILDIEGINKSTTSIINTVTKEVSANLIIKEFQFDNSFMQEQFNTHYLESDDYPDASFKGIINENIDFKKDGTYNISASGKLSIHGVTRKKTITGTLTIQHQQATLNTKFTIKPNEFKVDIPEIVFNKIAEVIEVTIKFDYLLEQRP